MVKGPIPPEKISSCQPGGRFNIRPFRGSYLVPPKKSGIRPKNSLRTRAEKFLAKSAPDSKEPPLTELQNLVHELQVHQVELDMQNEDLRRSQQESAEARTKYADLYDSAPIGYFTFDPQGIILEVNLTGARLLGVERDALRHTRFIAHVAPAGREVFHAHLGQAFATQAPQTCILQLATRADAVLYVAIQSLAVAGAQPDLSQCRSVVSDITAYRMANETLKASEVSYRAIFDNANDAIFIHDAVTGAILDVNRKVEEIYGYTASEALNLRLEDISAGQPPYTQEYVLTRIRLAALGEPQLFEWLCKDKSGGLFWVEVSLKHACIDGQARVLAIVRDVSVRKEAEKNIKTTAAFLENIIASSVDPIAIMDENGHCIKWNQAAEEAFGYSMQEVSCLTDADLYAHEDALKKMLRQLDRDGFVRCYEIDIKKKDGTIAPFSLSIRLLRDDNGKSLRSVCVARDLSKTRKALADSEQLNARLQDLVQESVQRNQELTIINSMAEKLQSCLSGEEAYPIIAQHALTLFPAKAGALLIHNPANSLLEAVSTWGDAVAGELIFTPSDCWALRRGRLHLVEGSRRQMQCRHLPRMHPLTYFCLPLLAHGEPLGMLHVQDLSDFTPDQAETLRNLAVTVGDQISLGLANIRLRESLRHQVIHDALTGLYNRRYLEETLEREVYRVQRKRSSLGIIMLDLDHFKHFNDAYGHEAGDNLLRTLGNFLAGRVRKEDVACRYGGEEFVLIMPDASLETVLHRAEEIRLEFPKRQVLHREQVLENVTVSLGVAMFPEHGATGQDVLHAADGAMYRAKDAGRNLVMVAANRTPPGNGPPAPTGPV